MRDAFLDDCAVDFRVYYNYECTDEEEDRYVKAHIQNNWKQLLSKEKTRANERVKLAKSLGYTHATRALMRPHYFNKGAWESICKHWETDKFKKAWDNGKRNRAKLDFGHKSGTIPFCVRRWELDAKLEAPMSNLEFFKYVYNIDEPTLKKIMISREEPLSPASHRKRDLCLLMQARKPKKNKLMLYPRNSLSEVIGADEAARLNPSQSTHSSQNSIPDDAYSIIRRVLSEVSIAVSSMEGTNQVPRAELNETLEKLTTKVFPDRADPMQQSSWDQYMRIAGEVIGQVMQNFKKILWRDINMQNRHLLEMDLDDDRILIDYPLYK